MRSAFYGPPSVRAGVTVAAKAEDQHKDGGQEKEPKPKPEARAKHVRKAEGNDKAEDPVHHGDQKQKEQPTVAKEELKEAVGVVERHQHRPAGAAAARKDAPLGNEDKHRKHKGHEKDGKNVNEHSAENGVPRIQHRILGEPEAGHQEE